jgi:hypothetical protein
MSVNQISIYNLLGLSLVILLDMDNLPVTVALVALRILVSEESNATLVAVEYFKNLVALLMNEFVTFRYKPLWTIIALIILLTGMDFLVVNQAVFELKFLPTDLVRALVGLWVAEQLQIMVYDVIFLRILKT